MGGEYRGGEYKDGGNKNAEDEYTSAEKDRSESGGIEKRNPLTAWAVASQLAFVILTPLLVFIVGGYYVVKWCELPDWVMTVCVVLGVIFMISGASNHIMKMIRLFSKDDKSKYRSYYSDRRDNDYYDDRGQ